MEFSNWLLKRYQYDANAKNSYIQKALLELFRNHSSIRVVDLGTGMGANFYYYRYLFPSLQTWWLLDNDASLLEKSASKIWEKAYEEGYQLKQDQGAFTLNGKNKKLTIHTTCASILDLKNAINLGEIDLVMANAVFDLFTSDDFEQVANLCASHEIPFLSTLNYQGMKFNPASQNDNNMIRLYEKHMQRVLDSGKSAMGPECCIRIKETLMNTGMEAANGASLWHIPAKDGDMLLYYLEFMEEALKTMDIDNESLENWLRTKKEMVKQKQVALEVYHEDIIAYPMSHS